MFKNKLYLFLSSFILGIFCFANKTLVGTEISAQRAQEREERIIQILQRSLQYVENYLHELQPLSAIDEAARWAELQAGLTVDEISDSSEYFLILQQFNENLKYIIPEIQVGPAPIAALAYDAIHGIFTPHLEGEALTLFIPKFPPENNWATLGISGANIQCLALPNDLDQWPEDALSACSHLQFLTTFGPSPAHGTITLTAAHQLQERSLQSIELPASVCQIGDGDETAPIKSVFNPVLKNIRIPKNIISIGLCSFYNCENLQELDLSHTDLSEGIQAHAFSNCRQLAFVNFANSRLTMIGSEAFSQCPALTELDLSSCKSLATIADGAFSACTALVSVKFPQTLTEIGAYAFASGVEEAAPLPSLQNIFWGGSTRPSALILHPKAFGADPAELITSGVLTEFFTP